MLVLLPLSAGVLLALIRIGRDRNPVSRWEVIVESVLWAAALWGAVVIVSSELLSLVRALHQLGVAAVWAVACVALLAIGKTSGALRRGLHHIRPGWQGWTTAEKVLLCGIATTLVVLLLVAWVSPITNIDSLKYHMSRVVHWAQQASFDHYATAHDHQLLKPIWAETAILHLRVLWGSDKPANLVQWISLVLSVVGLTGLAARLGMGRSGQLLTAAFAVTVPMAVAQASSTQNDLVAGFWSVVVAFTVVTSRQRRLRTDEWLVLGLALGVGFLTKGTFYVYAPPFMLWYFVSSWRDRGLRRVLLEGAAMFVVAAALNVGFWARNIQTFGGLYGPPDFLQRNLWIRFLPADEAGEPTDLESGPPEGQAFPREPSLSGTPEAQQPPGEWLPSQPPRNAAFNWARRVLRTAAYNLVTPSFALNRVLETALRSVPSVFDEAYLVDWRNVAWNHEDTASSPIHFGLILVCLAAILVTRPANGLRQTKVYAGLVALTFGMLPVVIGHAPSIWGIRYQLPFFLLASPLPGMLLAQRPRLWPSVILGAGLLLSAIPLLLFNNTRPLVGRPPWPTRVGSILTTPASDLVFAITPATQESYEGATELLRASECRDIGLRLDSGDLEYIFWWLLQAPQSGFRLQTLYTVPRLQFLVDREFRPCAILCTICGERTRVHGLTRIADYPFVDVFAGSSFVWEEDG